METVCGHPVSGTCNGPYCFRAKERPQEPPEIRIERARQDRIAHARALFHMGVAALEAKLDEAIAEADKIAEAELATRRHTAHEFAGKDAP